MKESNTGSINLQTHSPSRDLLSTKHHIQPTLNYIEVLVVQSHSKYTACKIRKGCEETALAFQFMFLQLTESKPKIYQPAWVISKPVKSDFM